MGCGLGGGGEPTFFLPPAFFFIFIFVVAWRKAPNPGSTPKPEAIRRGSGECGSDRAESVRLRVPSVTGAGVRWLKSVCPGVYRLIRSIPFFGVP